MNTVSQDRVKPVESPSARMRILMSAYACAPNSGSESGIGWNWALQAAKTHDVWLVTQTANRTAIADELARRQFPNLHVIYHQVPSWIITWGRPHYVWYLDYLLWQLTAIPRMRALNRHVRFDAGHHVTLGTLRMPSFLAWLGVPFVWGPVGGGEQAPIRLVSGSGSRAFVRESARTISNAMTRFNPLIRITARRASVIVATTSDTRAKLPYASSAKTRVASAIGLDTSADEQPTGARDGRGPVRLLFVGRLEHWKGVQFAIRAVADALQRGADVHFTIVGDGPFRRNLDALTAVLDIGDYVDFAGDLPMNEALQRYHESDVFLFPSLHDSGGFAVLEAMAASVPVICLDLGGPAVSVTQETGIKVFTGTPAQVVDDLAGAIIRLANYPRQREEMGQAGKARVEHVFGWDRKEELLKQWYAECVTSRQSLPQTCLGPTRRIEPEARH